MSSQQNEKVIDWFRIIVDLERSSYTHMAIAAAVGVSKRTVGGWKEGSEPRYSSGDSLLLLWSTVTGKGREAAPMVGRFDWH